MTGLMQHKRGLIFNLLIIDFWVDMDSNTFYKPKLLRFSPDSILLVNQMLDIYMSKGFISVGGLLEIYFHLDRYYKTKLHVE